MVQEISVNNTKNQYVILVVATTSPVTNSNTNK